MIMTTTTKNNAKKKKAKKNYSLRGSKIIMTKNNNESKFNLQLLI